MAHLIDKDALVAEIERRQSEHNEKKYDYASTDHFWRAIEDKDILSFINTLEVKEVQEEPVSEDLEEAAISYAATGEFLDNGKEMIDFQKEMSFKAGAKWQITKLMKDATEAIVAVDADGYPYVDKTIELYDYDKDVPLAKYGDKYKVILIKED